MRKRLVKIETKNFSDGENGLHLILCWHKLDHAAANRMSKTYDICFPDTNMRQSTFHGAEDPTLKRTLETMYSPNDITPTA